MLAKTPEAEKSRNMLSTLETIVLHEFMKDKVRKVPDTDLCEYIDDWSDAKIAEKAPVADCTSSNVAGIRKQVWGNLKPATLPVAPTTNALQQRIEALENRDKGDNVRLNKVEALVDRIEALEKLAGNTAKALNGNAVSFADRLGQFEIELGKLKLALKNRPV